MVWASDVASGRYTQRQGRHLNMKALKAFAAKKTIFALVLALTIFGAIYGFAATLNVGSDRLSAGAATLNVASDQLSADSAALGSCQPPATPTGSTYTVAYDSAVPGYKV